MPDHPANIRRSPDDVAGAVNVEEVANRQIQTDSMAARVSHNTLGCSRRARGVDDVYGIGALDRHAVGLDAARLGAARKLLPGRLPAGSVSLAPAELFALPDDGALGLVGGQPEGFLDEWPVGDGGLVAVDAARGGQEDFGLASVDALGEGVGREPAKDDGVDGAEPVDCHDANQCRRDHGH